MPRPARSKTADSEADPKVTGSKAEFVRGLPASMTAAQVVAKAKEAGLSLSQNYVYKLRSDSGRKVRKSSKVGVAKNTARVTRHISASNGAQSKSAKTNTPASQSRPTTVEREFTRLVLDLGLRKVNELLANVKSQLAGLVG